MKIGMALVKKNKKNNEIVISIKFDDKTNSKGVSQKEQFIRLNFKSKR